MPRETLNIELFNRGIVSSPDVENSGVEAACFALDVENSRDEGILEGRLGDVSAPLKDLGAGVLGPLATSCKNSAWLTRENGQRDLVFYAHDGEVNAVVDFYGGQSVVDEETHKNIGTGKTTSLVQHNHEVHMGTGSEELDKPRWIGLVKGGQFGSQINNRIHCTEAEVKRPEAFPILSKIVVDADYVYGIESGEDKIYKIDKATGVITSRGGDNTFKKLQALCDENGTHFWVYDSLASTYGSILKIAKSDLSITSSSSLASFGSESGAYLSDMVATNGKIWLAFYQGRVSIPRYYEDIVPVEVWLFSLAKGSIPGTNITVDNNTPEMGTSGSGVGSWTDSAGNARNTLVEEFYRVSLVKLSSTKVGWACRMLYFRQNWAQNQAFYRYKNTTGPTSLINARSIMYVVAEGSGNIYQPIIIMDNTPSFRGMTGVWYDEANTTLYWTRDKTIFRKTGITIPTLDVAGSSYDATTPTNSAATTYNEGVMSIADTSGADLTDLVYLSRIDSKAGVDKIATDLTGYGTLLEGTQVAITPSIIGTNSFSEKTKYYWKASFVYDGYQYSPLSEVLATQTNGGGVFSARSLSIAIRDISQIPSRVTSIAIFRSRSPESDASPTEFYRQVTLINLDTATFTISGVVATIVVVDDVDDVGAPYTQITGMPESLETSMVNYALSTSHNGSLFVTKCFKKELDGASHFLFRSKPSRYDMFDWSNDFLRLPDLPVAMATFAGKVWVFTHTKTFMINADGLYIEDTFEGIGADNDRSVLVAETGMYVCNKSGIWVSDGRKFTNIASPIESKSTAVSGVVSWRDVTHTSYGPIIIGDFKNNSVLFVVSTDSNGSNMAFVFNYLKNTWEYWTLKSSSDGSATSKTYTGGFTGKNGEGYFSNWNDCQEIHSSGTRKEFTWISKLFTFEDNSQIKKVYKVIPQYDGTAATISYARDGGTSFTNTSGNLIAVGDRVMRALMVKVVGVASTKIRSLGIVYRRMIGKR